MNFRGANLTEVSYYLSRLSDVAVAIDKRALSGRRDSRVNIYTNADSSIVKAQ